MSSQSPFELRMQMLEMAKEYLDQQYTYTREAILQSWHDSIEYAEKVKGVMPIMPEMPKMYDISEIAKMAETFNDFVSNKK